MTLEEKLELLEEFLSELDLSIEAGVDGSGDPWLEVIDKKTYNSQDISSLTLGS